MVIDTNIVLDLFVFADAAAQTLRNALVQDSLQWLATVPMREELERVLDYPQIASRLAYYAMAPATVMAAFDRHVCITDIAPKAAVTCADADDQKFIDLAVAHGATLVSKDNAVLGMRRRLLPLGVVAASVWACAEPSPR